MRRNTQWHRNVMAAVADQATGCVENAPRGGQLWATGAVRKVSDAEARRLFRDGVAIAAPNAGAGSYGDVLARLGFKGVEAEDTGSSAGDWTLRVHSGLVFQSNRYPYHGFEYQYQRDASLRTPA